MFRGDFDLKLENLEHVTHTLIWSLRIVHWLEKPTFTFVKVTEKSVTRRLMSPVELYWEIIKKYVLMRYIPYQRQWFYRSTELHS